MPHEAFHVDLRPIVENLPASLKIECLHAYGDKLLVGTNTGALLIFQIKDELDGDSVASEAPSAFVSLLDTKKQFARKAIEQLETVKELDMLFALSGTPFLHV